MASSRSSTESLVEPTGSPPTRLTAVGRRLTRTKAFRLLVDHCFDMIDDSGDGIIDEAELYAGLLLVHIKLAKHAGPAALYPPSRAATDRMFRAADPDQSGSLDREEFHWIMGIMTAQILGRMLVFYLVMILTVPILTSWVIRGFKVPEKTYLAKLVQVATAMLIFYLIIPSLWNKIDERYSGNANETYNSHSQDLMSPNREEQREARSGKRHHN